MITGEDLFISKDCIDQRVLSLGKGEQAKQLLKLST